MRVRVVTLIAGIALLSVAMTGCWDLKEPNELSYVLGSGWDQTKEGQIELSVMIPLPRATSSEQAGGSGGGSARPYTVVSASGNNIVDAARHIQSKVSRQLFPGHRIAVFISEDVAKEGIVKWLDELMRNPESNTRASLFVVKGVRAKKFFETQYAMERFPAFYAFRTGATVGFRENTIFDFQREMNSPSKCFFLPVVESDSKSKDQQLRIQEIAVFNKAHTMVGTLKDRDAFLAVWAAGKLSRMMITHTIPEGTISLNMHHLKRKVKVAVNGGQIQVNLKLSGRGEVRENNTNLNLLSPEVKEHLAEQMNKLMQEEIKQVIQSVQKQYKTDIFGFGNQIGWKHPRQWDKLAEHWDETFSNAEVAVDIHVTIVGVGQTGSGPKSY